MGYWSGDPALPADVASRSGCGGATGRESTVTLARAVATFCAKGGAGGARGDGARSVEGGLNVSESISRLTSRAAAAFNEFSSSRSSMAGTGTRRDRTSIVDGGAGAGSIGVGVRAGQTCSEEVALVSKEYHTFIKAIMGSSSHLIP